MPTTVQDHPATGHVPNRKTKESPREHVANALQILRSGAADMNAKPYREGIDPRLVWYDGAGINVNGRYLEGNPLADLDRLLSAALERLDQDKRIAEDIASFARQLDLERKAEIHDLQQQLREAQETIRQYGEGRWHLRVSWSQEHYVVERRWVAGVYRDWEAAKAHARMLLGRGETVTDHTNQAVLSAAGD